MALVSFRLNLFGPSFSSDFYLFILLLFIIIIYIFFFRVWHVVWRFSPRHLPNSSHFSWILIKIPLWSTEVFICSFSLASDSASKIGECPGVVRRLHMWILNHIFTLVCQVHWHMHTEVHDFVILIVWQCLSKPLFGNLYLQNSYSRL